MQINFFNQSPNFKQIKLSDTEFTEAQNKFNFILLEPHNSKHNYKMFDLFEPHLNNEVELKQYQTGKERKYFSANLYVKFFEILDSTKNQNLPFEKFIENLNNYINKFIIKRKPEEDYIKLQDYNVSTAKKAAQFLYEYLNMSKEEFLKAAQETPFFPNTSKSYLDKTINDLTNNLGYTQEECIEIYKKNPEAMLYSSQFIIGNANNTMKLLNIENTEEFREMTSTNPFLINFKELETSIKNIREFLDTDDETVKKMIKAQPFLGTMKFEHLKSNFYNFKNHINVTRERMSEIAIMSPITLTVPFDLNKKKYENISKTLNILPETFYKKANVLPAMYRINTKKIEKYIDYVSKLFNYSRQEAINYIAQNLNILSYKFSNIVNRSEKNYEILNNTLNINFNSYLDMVEENAWILGHQPDFIKKTIKDVKKYFNVDKETLAIMLKKNPQMVTSFINNIDKNADKVSGYFNINKETFKKLCIIEPKLATRFITLHQSDIPYNATVLEMSEKDFIKLGLENPTLLIENYETIYDIKERVDFSGTINQEEMNLANPAINDEKSFFEETLACAIASALGLSIKNKKISIPEMFSQCKKAFVELKVPKHILSERFGEFAKEFIKNNNLENRCKILIKKI